VFEGFNKNLHLLGFHLKSDILSLLEQGKNRHGKELFSAYLSRNAIILWVNTTGKEGILRTITPLLGVILISALALQAKAQESHDEQRARDHFNAGTSYYEESRFDDAVREFKEAYRLSHHSVLLINIARAYEHALQFDEAIVHYQQYLDEKPDAADRDAIEARIEYLKKMSEKVQQGEVAQEQALEPLPTSDVPEQLDQPQEESEFDEQAETQSSEEQGLEESGSSIIPWVIGGTGLALLAAGTVTGIMALGKQSDLDENCYDKKLCLPSEQDNIDSLKTLALVTDILLPLGGAAVVTAAVWILIENGGSESDTPGRAGLFCTSDGCTASTQITF